MQEQSKQAHTWFLRLRLFAALGAFVAFTCLHFGVDYRIHFGWVSLTLAAVPLSHVLVARSFQFDGHASGKFLLLLDSLVLTILLALSGGPANPFSIVYLVYVVLASLMFGKVWTWIIAALSSLFFAMLFLLPTEATTNMHAHHSQDYELHLYSMLGSYFFVSITVAYFLGKISDELREHQRRVLELSAARERLLSLTALSTNAAHELGSPLTSIEVIAHEIADALRMSSPLKRNELTEDVMLLTAETQRCKMVLRDLCSQAGALQGEPLVWIDLPDLKQALEQSLPQASRSLHWNVDTDQVKVPKRGLEIALRALVQNAIDASVEDDAVVEVELKVEGDCLRLVVKDYGEGASAAQVARFSEPFYTTKGSGMGLGSYLVQLFAEQTSGSLAYQSSPGLGTTATLRFPAESLSISSSRAA